MSTCAVQALADGEVPPHAPAIAVTSPAHDTALAGKQADGSSIKRVSLNFNGWLKNRAEKTFL
jgi:hypothetical protein